MLSPIRPDDGKQALCYDIQTLVMGGSAFRYLYAAIELRIFETLKSRPLSAGELATVSGIDSVRAPVLLRGLLHLGLLVENANELHPCDMICGMMVSGEWHVFRCWIRFEAMIAARDHVRFVSVLRGQSEREQTLYRALERDPGLKSLFYEYMSAWSSQALPTLFSHVTRLLVHLGVVLDVGGGDGTVAKALLDGRFAEQVLLLDLQSPCSGLGDGRGNLKYYQQDFFDSTWPIDVDTVLFCHQLMIWSDVEVQGLLRRAQGSLRRGGRIVIFESMGGWRPSATTFAVLDSVYFQCNGAGRGWVRFPEDYVRVASPLGLREVGRTESVSWTSHVALTLEQT